jgi:hypothetical protein
VTEFQSICANCDHAEVSHTAAGSACYVDGCMCDRFNPPATTPAEQAAHVYYGTWNEADGEPAES